jgi:hypothetical protein
MCILDHALSQCEDRLNGSPRRLRPVRQPGDPIRPALPLGEHLEADRHPHQRGSRPASAAGRRPPTKEYGESGGGTPTGGPELDARPTAET